jgi:hypothetical protein
MDCSDYLFEGQGSAGGQPECRSGAKGSQERNRLPAQVINDTLALFSDGSLTWQDAAVRLDVSRSQLYNLRTTWLANGKSSPPKVSGGDHKGPWPPEVTDFIKQVLKIDEEPNYSFIRDEIKRRFTLSRSVSNVRNHVLKTWHTCSGNHLHANQNRDEDGNARETEASFNMTAHPINGGRAVASKSSPSPLIPPPAASSEEALLRPKPP